MLVSHLGMGFRCGSQIGILFWGLRFEGLQGGNMSSQTSCEVGVVCNIVCWNVMARCMVKDEDRTNGRVLFWLKVKTKVLKSEIIHK